MTSASSVVQRPAAAGVARLVGVDLARFLAIAGMITAHVVPEAAGTPLGFVVEGNASTLFAVLGGVSVVLATRRRLGVGDVRAARRALAVRGLLVAAVGLTAAFLPSPAIVVLVYFGVALLCAVPLIRVRSGVLLAVAGALVLGGAVLNQTVRGALGVVDEGGSIAWTSLADPLTALRATLLTGTYPVLTWFAYILVGIVIGRILVMAEETGRLRSVAAVLAAVGTAVFAASSALSTLFFELVTRTEATRIFEVGFGGELPADLPIESLVLGNGFGGPAGYPSALLVAAPHTGTALDMLRGIGFALLVLGACLLVEQALTPRPLAALRPITSAGAAPLTSYLAHLTLFALLPATTGAAAVALHVGLVLAIGALLATLHRRGPAEALVSTISSRVAAAAASASASAAASASASASR